MTKNRVSVLRASDCKLLSSNPAKPDELDNLNPLFKPQCPRQAVEHVSSLAGLNPQTLSSPLKPSQTLSNPLKPSQTLSNPLKVPASHPSGCSPACHCLSDNHATRSWQRRRRHPHRQPADLLFWMLGLGLGVWGLVVGLGSGVWGFMVSGAFQGQGFSGLWCRRTTNLETLWLEAETSEHLSLSLTKNDLISSPTPAPKPPNPNSKFPKTLRSLSP